MEHDEEEEKKEEVTRPPIEYRWTTELQSVCLSRFRSPSGSQTPLSDPLDLLQLFLPPSFMELVATNTTAYAHTKGASSDWHTTMEELYIFLAVHICMGICPYPQVHMYWSETHRHPFVSLWFTRDRFMELLRYFHISSPGISSCAPKPLGKVLPLLDSLARSFPLFLKPSREMTVDEAMVGFKGRSVIKQYIPINRLNGDTKYGV